MSDAKSDKSNPTKEEVRIFSPPISSHRIEPLLRWIDEYMHIEAAPKLKPLDLAASKAAKENRSYFLKQNQSASCIEALYAEAGSEMRVLRNTEFQGAALFYQVCGFILTLNTAVMVINWPPTIALCLIPLISCTFLVCYWCTLHARIAHDHMSYAYHMNIKRSAENYWLGIGFIGKPKNTIHKKGSFAGPGYRNTQALIALSTIFVLITSGVLLLVVMGIFLARFISACEI